VFLYFVIKPIQRVEFHMFFVSIATVVMATAKHKFLDEYHG